MPEKATEAKAPSQWGAFHHLVMAGSGGFAGVVAKTVTSPLERVRIMAQTGHGRGCVSEEERGLILDVGVWAVGYGSDT
jgi:hypothetical protein